MGNAHGVPMVHLSVSKLAEFRRGDHRLSLAGRQIQDVHAKRAGPVSDATTPRRKETYSRSERAGSIQLLSFGAREKLTTCAREKLTTEEVVRRRSMSRTRKRPCRICRRWFYPDPRAGDRQRACSRPACQATRRQKTQANWRAENHGYAAYRIDQRHRSPTEEGGPLRVPAPFHELWIWRKTGSAAKALISLHLHAHYSKEWRKTNHPAIPLNRNGFRAITPSRRKRPVRNPRILKPVAQQLEFHQLDRRLEHLRVRHPARFRRLLASLAEAGQQTPILVIQQADQYLVIDGHQRIAALRQLRRDTVEVRVLDNTMSEAEALLFVHSLRSNSEPETALEQGWLLAEMEEKHGYTIEELARHFDRSATWVARRLALVETLPEAVQQQVREGRIAAQIAMIKTFLGQYV
jgi:ParB/RepB/Spo0J family partition protein